MVIVWNIRTDLIRSHPKAMEKQYNYLYTQNCLCYSADDNGG